MRPAVRAQALAALFMVAGFPNATYSAEARWKKYENARFGFVLTYPPGLESTAEAMNGGGREFHTSNKEFSVAASGHFFVPGSGDSFERRWRDELALPHVAISYKRKTPDWYVVSGTAADGTEYYHRLYRQGSSWAAFQITYPRTQARKYDAWVKEIGRRFIPFRAGDFDRLLEDKT